MFGFFKKPNNEVSPVLQAFADVLNQHMSDYVTAHIVRTDASGLGVAIYRKGCKQLYGGFLAAEIIADPYTRLAYLHGLFVLNDATAHIGLKVPYTYPPAL